MRKIFLILFVFVFMGGVAMASPILPDGYEWSNDSYFTVTDNTTVADGSILSMILAENAAYESDFGIYYLNNDEIFKYEIFSYDQEPSSPIPTTQTLYFQLDSGVWSVSKDFMDWTEFSKNFGFYFGVHTDGMNTNGDADYYYYTDNSLNYPASEIGIDHIKVAFDGLSNVILYLDDQLFANADRDFNDMIVFVNDVTPVPEPGTLFLLGAGVVGLALYRRRSMNK